jgi:hypothetical protein
MNLLRCRRCFLSGFLAILWILGGGQALGQELPGKQWDRADLLPVEHIARSSISNLHAEGDTLWVGPALDLTTNRGETWHRADLDSLEGRHRVYSLDVEGSVVWAGLGYAQETDGTEETTPTAGGFVYSIDGGQTWNHRPPPLDDRSDSTETYGASVLPALPVVVPQQSPPYDIDYDRRTGTVWTAGWASGLRVSNDSGETWDRVVLPPDTLDALHPDSSYSFPVGPQRTAGEQANNYLGFSVLVDEVGTVWAGTAAGLNRSTHGVFSPVDSMAWQRFSFGGSPGNLVSNWIISIEEQPVRGIRNPVWMATWPTNISGEQYGVTVTRDGGETFETVLTGDKVNDLAFRGDTVLAASERGLMLSANAGDTWRIIRNFRLHPESDAVVRPDVSALSVATTPAAIWVGTNDGLLRSTDGGQRWKVFRPSVPTSPQPPTDRQPRVDTYAYPNPYSPGKDGYVRIRYDLETAGNVRVRIFDFGMNPVATVADERQAAGAREKVWDGTTGRGDLVANGTYLYAVETPEDTYWGKILVLR